MLFEKAGHCVQKQKLVNQAAALFCASKIGRKVRTPQGKAPHVYAYGIASEGSAGNILQERIVSQKIHIPFFSKEENEKQVKWWCKRPPHRQ
jgi:hypothetical protein